MRRVAGAVKASTETDAPKPKGAAKASMARKKKRKVAVFIDGSNFYFKVRSLTKKKTNFMLFDYKGLLRELAGPDATIVHAGYYVGVVRAKGKSAKAQELRKHQQQLFDQLRVQGLTVITGFLMEHDGKYYEKGVDVRIALDIATGAYEKQYDEAVLISSDTDLLPAVQKAQASGRPVHYVGFSHQPSLALISRCATSRLLTEKDINTYARTKRLVIKRFDEA
jgi:uncharacterized LabA/DUF88 family protein